MRQGLIKRRDKWSFGRKDQGREGEVAVAVVIISGSKIHKLQKFHEPPKDSMVGSGERVLDW